MDPSELAAVPVVQDQREQSWAKLGLDYEDRVIRKLASQTSVLVPSPGDYSLTEGQAFRFLRGESSSEYASQINLRPKSRPSFLESAIDIHLRRTLPDLVRKVTTDDGLRLQIIDIKATRIARSFHKTQVAYYALVMDEVLQEISSNARIDSVGEIWRIPDDGNAEGSDWAIEHFELGPYVRLVKDFCRINLPSISAAQVNSNSDETFFHVYFKCEQCKYLPHCISSVDSQRPASRRDISAVAGLSHEAKRTLQKNGVRTVAALAGMGDGVGRIDGAGWSLSRRAETLVKRAQAQRDDAIGDGPIPHTFLMPARTDVAIYLVADNDPVDDTLITLGYRIVDPAGSQDLLEVLPTSNRAEEADALIRVFGKLISDLQRVHEHNANLYEDHPDALHAHILVYEPSEAISLQNAVRRHLDDPRIREGLLHMVRLFPPDEIVPEPEFRGVQHLPATALRSVVEQLLSLPVSVSYDLRQVSGAMQRKGLISSCYKPTAAFERPFSSLLALDICRDLREGRNARTSVEDVRADVVSRLDAMQEIADWLRVEHLRRIERGGEPMLRLRKKPFQLQETFDPLTASDLDVLRAFEILENRTGLLETLIRLAQPKRVRRDSGRAIGPMRLLNISEKGNFAYFMFKVPKDCEDSDLSTGTMGLILSDGEPDFILEPRVWPNISCDLLDKRNGDSVDLLRARVFVGNFKSDAFKEVRSRAEQEGWWLDTSFVDWNSEKASDFLSFLGAETVS